MPLPEAPTKLSSKVWQGRAMASLIEVQMTGRRAHVEPAVQRALAVFKDVEDACTRFRPSPLTKANEDPERWHRAPRLLMRALREAHAAYLDTGGVFDPRVHDDLVGLGYSRSFALGPDRLEGDGEIERDGLASWTPRFVAPLGLARIGSRRIDLGGIGKGLAVRWAVEELRKADDNFLINAGGDCYAGGLASPGIGWRVGVEDPAGGDDPVAVVEVSDLGVATSSIRIRHWISGERVVHHIIDPRTGQPGSGGLSAVTVLNPDPARAEVWSKVCFLAGRSGIGDLAEREALPVLWVTDSGEVGMSRDMTRYVIWTRD